jgi:hypothetical protein
MKPRIQFRAMVPLDHAEFTEATSYHPGPQFGGIVAWYWNGTRNITMGMVGLDGWTPTSVGVHWYIRHPRCIMPLWYELLVYLHSHGKRKLIGTTPSNNVRALRMIFNRLGWREIARINDGWDTGVDIVISEYNIDAAQMDVARNVA